MERCNRRQQLPDSDGLSKIKIGARKIALLFIRRRRSRRQDDDTDAGRSPPNALDNAQPIFLGKIEIDDQKIDTFSLENLVKALATIDPTRLIPFKVKTNDQLLKDKLIILNNNNFKTHGERGNHKINKTSRPSSRQRMSPDNISTNDRTSQSPRPAPDRDMPSGPR